ncbi:hypothetical protein H5410_010742 [Solanum commersonii]|uniref:Uncharacterized protein n=1 Tax=Solanum commersonii TaxID=4109 RepID=A0A9J6AME0_SOLCO|nr:hypothetical protein H5410_010742 [Solanum commersonii]
METSEPTLAPQWLRSSKHVTSFVTTSSPLHPDDAAPSKLAHKRSLSVNTDNKEWRRPAASDRAISSRTRWSSNSSNSPNFQSYNSFRNHHRDIDKDINNYRETSTLRNHRSRDFPDTSRKHHWEIFEEGLRQSPSMTSGGISEKWPRNLSNAGKIKLPDNNGMLASVCGADKAIECGIRPLVTEKRQASPGLGRVGSPGLGTRTQSIPTSPSGTTGNKLASALAVTTAVAGNDNSGLSSMKRAASSGLSSPIFSKSSGRCLNMAETVAKGLPCAQTISQVSQANHRLEELAMKQSRQLIPLVAKASVPNPSDKSRTKVELRQQIVSSSHPVGHSLSSVCISSRIHVYKPTRERNGVSSVVNSSLSPNIHSRGPNALLVVPVSASTHSPANIAAPSTFEPKPVGTMVQKKLSSQARSRNDFFDLMRKKSNAHGITQDQDASLSDETPRVEQSTEILGENTCNSDSSDGKNTDKSFSNCDAMLCSDEEEAALLRSMGWEENADEGGLTEEEISAFYKDVTKCINSKLSFKTMPGLQSKFMLPLHSGIGGVGAISS